MVLGGVALTGGVGGLVGPVLAAGCLALIPAIMLGLGWDPSNAETARGVIIILVVLVAGLVRTGGGHERDVTTREPEPTAAESTAVVAEIAREAARPGWRVRLAEQPTLVLAIVFVVLYAVTVWQDDSLLRSPASARSCSSPPHWRSSRRARRCAC